MDHQEQHHQHHHKERENRLRRKKARDHGNEGAWPIHPFWLLVLGVTLTLLVVLVWISLIP